MRGGHRLITFLESPATSGVGILVHSDYTKYIIKKYLISDRSMAIDVKIGMKRIRIICVYVPHAGYTWVDFEDCMNDISILVSEATRSNMSIIIGRDFILFLGIGSRGRYMNERCQQFRLEIANGNGLVGADTN